MGHQRAINFHGYINRISSVMKEINEKASIVVEAAYQKNKLFDLSDQKLNRDNCLYPFYCLRERLRELNIDLATSDINCIVDSDIILYNEMPKKMPSEDNIHKSFLIIFESEVIRPDNWDKGKHRFFNKIFTWNDNFIDEKKYFKINFPQEIRTTIDKNLRNKKKMFVLIAGNKLKKHTQELYSERIKAIKWFEKYHPEDFDLYGIGWDKYVTRNRYFNFILSKFPRVQVYLANEYKSYRGPVSSKYQTLATYKYAICYENARDFPGYITEKIIDCLMSGCVPIYWGANNIIQYVPSDCFIDKRDFDTYESLYEYIASINDYEYMDYLRRIEAFLHTKKAYYFSSAYFTEKIVSELF